MSFIAATISQSSMATEDSTEIGKPNVIFILADDLGYHDLGCYGQKHILTPNIDRMASEGMRFTQCYSGSAVCAPSRNVLMTGQHTGHTRIRNNFAKAGGIMVLDNGPPQRRVTIGPDDVTVAEILRGAGYATGMTGKWGIAEPGTEAVPTHKGFDEWFGYLNQRRAHTYYPPFLWRGDERIDLDENRDGRRGQYSHDLFADFALDFLHRHYEEPLFLYLPFTLPHPNYEIPSTDPYADREWSDEEKTYAAMVSRLDRDVGRVFGTLRELGIDERTLVFLASDNGAGPGWEGRFDSLGSFRGHKGDLYEGGIRVPMVARWPGRIPRDTTSKAPWYFADFLPTVCEAAGLRPPGGLDGSSILPTLLGREQDLLNRTMYWEFPDRDFQQALRRGRSKAIRPSRGAPLEIYDLEEDPEESRDLSGQHPDLVEEFSEYMANAHTDSEFWPVGD
jgi:arylsulfatase A-like enzyme